MTEKRLQAWPLCLVRRPYSTPSSTMRTGHRDEQDSLFPRHDKQEIIPPQKLYAMLNFAYIH